MQSSCRAVADGRLALSQSEYAELDGDSDIVASRAMDRRSITRDYAMPRHVTPYSALSLSFDINIA